MCRCGVSNVGVLMRKRIALFSAAILITAVLSFAAGMTAERSPQGEAISLVTKQAVADIRKAYSADWWTDTDVHEWSARRVWSPGYLDSTHDFFVCYSVNGVARASWLVNTKSGTVQRDPSSRPCEALRLSK